jgi:tetratricopeptide (TPR) repeat protein
MPPDETECENCGAFVIDEAVVRLCRAFGIPREKALALFEKGFRHPTQLKDRNVDDVLQRGENGLLFLCTNCGGFVATADLKCPRCGAEFEGEEEAPAQEKDILDTTLCPVCGADNDATWKECEICGEPLNGTETPPGEPTTPAPAAEAAPVPPTPESSETPKRVTPVESSTLDRIDDILHELDASVPQKPAPPLRRVAKRAKVPKVVKPVATEQPQVRSPTAPQPARPTLKPVKRRALRPVPRPARDTVRSAPCLQPVPRPSTVLKLTRAETPQRAPGRDRAARSAALPPSELTGGLTVAGLASLYLAYALGETYIAWGVAFVLTVLAAQVFAAIVSRRGVSVARTDGAALVAAAIASAAAPALSRNLSPILSAAGAVLLAYATRRLVKTAAKDLLVVACDVPLIALAVVTALGLAFAGSPEWTFGLLALAPWPAAVAVEGTRQRRAGLLLGKELTKAQGHLERQQYAASVKDFDRAIALGRDGVPGQEVPWYGKGASLILLGEYEAALRAIDKALDLNPRNEVAWLNKGNALTKMGRLVDALRCYNAAIKVSPRFEVAWNNKGNTLARLGHLPQALACYDRALEIDPEYRGAWVNKGYVLTKLGRYVEASACADRAIRLNERLPKGAPRMAETSTDVPSS